jgi:hypothetical protein
LTLETQSYQRQLDRIRDLPPEDSLSSLSILENFILVLRTCVYLPDADARGFYHETMTKNLWNRMAQLTLQARMPGPSGVDPAPVLPAVMPKKPEGTPRCSHCPNATVHSLLGLKPIKTVCLFLALPQLYARKAASESLALHQSDGGGSLPECCQAKLAEYAKLVK